MKRSGHHAIQNWILSGFSNPKLRINSPILSKGTTITTKKPKACFTNLNKLFGNFNSLNLLISNYENANLGMAHKTKLLSRTAIHIWPEAKKFHVQNSQWSNIPKPVLTIYKQHLKQALGIKNFLGNFYGKNFIVINFNKWFISAQYRRELIHQLNMTADSTPFKQVARNGGGSSFNGVKFGNKAHQMKVLERYKQFTKNKKFIRVFADTELIELAQQFGFPKVI
jgi:hypothetical protein